MTNTTLKIAIGSDHGGLALKNHIKDFLAKNKPAVAVQDLGTYGEESVDYPDFAIAVARSIQRKETELGILCCGTGIGMSIVANRIKGIRAAVVHNEFTAQMAKAHNNANILCLGGRVLTNELASKLVKIWLETDFEGGRHTNRLAKIDF